MQVKKPLHKPTSNTCIMKKTVLTQNHISINKGFMKQFPEVLLTQKRQSKTKTKQFNTQKETNQHTEINK